MFESLRKQPLVATTKERCRVCFTCVRECPAKAIRIVSGQAEVIAERCIGCGNCVRVCSQHAKEVRSSISEVAKLLASDAVVVACVAPSFPVEYQELDYSQVVGMMRALGFTYVVEVGFGADLVARAYQRFFVEKGGERCITTACPAIVAYVTKYHPALVKYLAPIASPMIATARAVRQRYGRHIKVVFIGPCIAKKDEPVLVGGEDEIEAVLTFAELKQLFHEAGVSGDNCEPSEFDPPHASMGGLFPVGRGLLQAAGLNEDLLQDEIVSTDGARNFVEAIREFEDGDLKVRLLDVLCCNGCIMGSGLTTDAPLFRRRAAISRYARQRAEQLNHAIFECERERYEYLDLAVSFTPSDLRLPAPSRDELKRILTRMGKNNPEDELNCGACGYESCVDHAVAIHRGLAESEMCLPWTIDQLKATASKLAGSYRDLASAQQQLVQSEKLASMGQLAAGIAHEVNNPLGIVLLYAHLLLERFPKESSEHEDLKMIVEQADRCKTIVGGLLNFARRNRVRLMRVELKAFLEKAVASVIVPPQVSVRVHCDDPALTADLDRDQMLQVVTNLLHNAIEAMPHGGAVDLTGVREGEMVKVVVSDTGCGIKEENLKMIFEPFFTTKQIGKGTGLGLAVAYGIVKMHRGRIEVRSNADPEKGPTGTTFTVTLPARSTEEEGVLA